jgi:hypothetical protein
MFYVFVICIVIGLLDCRDKIKLATYSNNLKKPIVNNFVLPKTTTSTCITSKSLTPKIKPQKIQSQKPPLSQQTLNEIYEQLVTANKILLNK